MSGSRLIPEGNESHRGKMFSLKQEGPDPSVNAWLGNPEAMQGLQDRGALGKGE